MRPACAVRASLALLLAAGCSGDSGSTAPVAVATVLVTADGVDTLSTTGRIRTYSGVVRDANDDPVPGATIVWSSSDPTVASVDPSTGVATALTDGTTMIRATAGAGMGERPLTVRRYASTFTLDPISASITTDGGTQLFAGAATDSASTPLPISWMTRNASVVSVSPTTGESTTATAHGNGDTFVLLSAGTRIDSAAVSVSGQAAVPLTAAIEVGDFFFRSVRNATQNTAVDTVAVGGVVTWTWIGAASHNVSSTGTPSFTSSPLQSTGTHQVTFASEGTYEYDCQVHPAMIGRIIVR